MPSFYERQLERVRQFNMEKFWNDAMRWQLMRPAILQQNQNLGKMGQNISHEVWEAQLEHERYGSEDYSSLAETAEGLDVFFFVLSLFLSNGMRPDFSKIGDELNGWGKLSSRFGAVAEVGGNLKHASLASDLHFLSVITLSSLAAVPMPINFDQVARIVILKNEANYPAQYFTGHQIDRTPNWTKEKEKEELAKIFKHARQCLKLIRAYYQNDLGKKDRTYGLHPGDITPKQSELILDYKNPLAFQELKALLYQGNDLPVLN